MDDRRFDSLARSLSSGLSRRSVSRGVATIAGVAGLSGLLTIGLGLDPEVADAKKKKKGCRKKGCPQPTNPCQVATCRKGKKKKKKNGHHKRKFTCVTDNAPNNSPCGSGQVCIAGACTSSPNTCPDGTICAGACVDLATDADNCGACGRACGGATVCRNGLVCEEATCLPVTSIGGDTSLAADGGITSTVTVTPPTYGVIRMADIPAGTTFSDITSMIATYSYEQGSCGAGTPRFLVYLDVAGEERCPYAAFPPLGNCGTGASGNTGNLVGNNTEYVWNDDLCGGSGVATNTYEEVLALYSSATVTQVQVVADSSNSIDSTVTINPCVVVTS